LVSATCHCNTLLSVVVDGLAKLHSNNVSAMEKVLDIDKDSGLADGGGSDDLPQAKIVGKADVYAEDSSDGKSFSWFGCLSYSNY